MRNLRNSILISLIAGAAAFQALPASAATAGSADARIEALEQKILLLERKLEQAQASHQQEQILQQQEELLLQKVSVLERKNELAEEAAIAAKKTTPVVKAGNTGFSLESADAQNVIKLRGLLQTDYRYFDQGYKDVRNRSNQRAGSLDENGFSDANDSWLARRIRPTIEGTLLGKYDFRFTPEFAGGSASVVDAYLDARLDPAFKIRVGKFKSFVGLERLQSGGDIKFLERSYVTNNILPNRDLGIAVHGDLASNRLNYAFGLNNGVSDGGNISTAAEFDSNKEFTGRLFATPFINDANALTGLGFGVAVTYADFEGEKNLNFTDTSAADPTRNGLPSYLTEGQNTFFRYSSSAVADGERFRISPQAHYYYASLGLLGEYALVEQHVSLASGGSPSAGGVSETGVVDNTVILPGTKEKLSHEAWQVAASYLVTGEEASFKGVKPSTPFDLLTGGWGAWELVARYSEMNLDEDTFTNKAGDSFSSGAYANLADSAQSAHTWTVGVNWYLNQNSRVALNYAHTSFDGGAGDGTLPIAADGSNVHDRKAEHALMSRFQVSY